MEVNKKISLLRREREYMRDLFRVKPEIIKPSLRNNGRRFVIFLLSNNRAISSLIGEEGKAGMEGGTEK
jgi:hypothetical protein